MAFFLATLVIWFFIWKYRIHVTISYEKPRKAKRAARPAAAPKATPIRTEDSATRQVASALRNLGCDREKAAKVAQKAVAAGGDFDAMLRRALQEAA